VVRIVAGRDRSNQRLNLGEVGRVGGACGGGDVDDAPLAADKAYRNGVGDIGDSTEAERHRVYRARRALNAQRRTLATGCYAEATEGRAGGAKRLGTGAESRAESAACRARVAVGRATAAACRTVDAEGCARIAGCYRQGPNRDRVNTARAHLGAVADGDAVRRRTIDERGIASSARSIAADGDGVARVGLGIRAKGGTIGGGRQAGLAERDSVDAHASGILADGSRSGAARKADIAQCSRIVPVRLGEATNRGGSDTNRNRILSKRGAIRPLESPF
jgi:hypothetical protein